MPSGPSRAAVLRPQPGSLSIPILLRDGDGGARYGNLVARRGLLLGGGRISRASGDVGPLPPLPPLCSGWVATPMHRPQPLSKTLPFLSAASEQVRKIGRYPLHTLHALLSISGPGLWDMVSHLQRGTVSLSGDGGGQPGDGDGFSPVQLHPHPPFLPEVCELLLPPQQGAREDSQKVPGEKPRNFGRLGK